MAVIKQGCALSLFNCNTLLISNFSPESLTAAAENAFFIYHFEKSKWIDGTSRPTMFSCLFIFQNLFQMLNLHNKSLIHTEGFNERKPLICLPRLKTFSAVQALLSKHIAAEL